MNVSSWLQSHKSVDAQKILAFVLEKDMSFLVAHNDYELTDDELDKANQMFEKRQQGKPLAYIFGFKEFYGRNFKVSSDVLIPRPESETIIDFVKDLQPHTILDIGTGSGCLAVTLSLELSNAKVTAIDLSERALKTAVMNNAMLGGHVKFVQSDLLAQVEGQYDVAVANLPYVNRKWDWLNFETLNYEPEMALYAEDEGLETIKRMITQVQERKCAKYLIIEADPCQHEALKQFALGCGLKCTRVENYTLQFEQY